MLSTEQKAMIRSIAKEQMASFLRIAELELYSKLVDEMREEGYDVDATDMLAYFSGQMELWEKIIEYPDKFTSLDEVNLGMVKHFLINEYYGREDSRGIWKKINIVDKLNKN